jgi:hypothetical protein
MPSICDDELLALWMIATGGRLSEGELSAMIYGEIETPGSSEKSRQADTYAGTPRAPI